MPFLNLFSLISQGFLLQHFLCDAKKIVEKKRSKTASQRAIFSQKFFLLLTLRLHLKVYFLVHLPHKFITRSCKRSKKKK